MLTWIWIPRKKQKQCSDLAHNTKLLLHYYLKDKNTLKIRLVIFYILVSRSCEMNPTNKYYVCIKSLHYCPKAIKNMYISYIVELSDMFFHYNEHTHTAIYFESIPHTPVCWPKYSLDVYQSVMYLLYDLFDLYVR